VLLIGLLSLSYEEIYDLSFKPLNSENLFNAISKKFPNNVLGYTVQDTGYKDKVSIKNTDLLLSFDKPASELKWDDTSQYTIKKAEYLFESDDKSFGKGYAEFFKPEHGVSITPQESLWLGRTGDLESFTIDFRFCAKNIDDNSYIFSKVGTSQGEEIGLQIFIHRGKLVCRFTKIFHDNSVAKDITMLGRENILAGKWYHFAISFDRATGKLSRYINNKEEEIKYMTSNGTPYGQILIPSFNKLTSVPNFGMVHIGKGFNGYLDEFRISYLDIEQLKLTSQFDVEKFTGVNNTARIPYNKPGQIRSEVYEFEGYGTRLINLNWDEILPDKTFIWAEFRISDTKFDETGSEIKWYRIGKEQRNIYGLTTDDGTKLSGKYYQWRVHLIPSPDGQNAPTLSKVRLQYKPDPAPSAPQDFKVTAIGNRYLKLSWKKNIEPDLGGYKIYYGVYPDKFDGIITHVNGSKIDNSVSSGKEIEIIIDNKIIEENMVSNPNMLDYPRIQNTIVYYFSVSAYDTYKEGTMYNHESALSQKVYGRPYAGSEVVE
jgi:hypothetical protein